MSETIPMRYCFNCGQEIGRMRYSERYDTCGSPACDREASDAWREERDNAHDQLDRDMGWL